MLFRSAPDAANADAAATVASVLDTFTALHLVDEMAGFSACLLPEEGDVVFSSRWPAA